MIWLKELFRDLLRHKGRTLAIIFVIALGISAVAIVDNINASLVATQKGIMERYQFTDISITSSDYMPSNISEIIMKEEGVELFELRLLIWGSWVFGDESGYARVTGVDGKPKINTVLDVNDSIWNEFTGNVCIIDKYYADKLNITVGDNVSITTTLGKINLRVLAFGDISWGVSFSRPYQIYFITPLDNLQKTLNLTGYINQVLIKVKDGYDKYEVNERLVELLKDEGYNVHGYVVETTNAGMPTDISIIFSMITFPALLIAGVLVLSVTLNKIMNEYRYIGIRKALGFTSREIFAMVMLESILLFLLSLPVAMITSHVITYFAIELAIKSWISYAVSAISPEGIVKGAVIGFIVVLLFTIYPAKKASGIDPLNAIRWGFETISYKASKKSSSLPKLVAMAWRNLLRRKKRTVFLIVMLVFGVMASTSIGILTSSVQQTYINTLNDNFKCDIMIYFADDFNTSQLNEVKKISGVDIAEGYVSLQTYAGNLDMIHNNVSVDHGTMHSSPLTFFVYPNSTLYHPKIVEGRWIQENTDVIISYKVAKQFNINIGDSLKLIYNYTYMNENRFVTFNYTVVGIAQIIIQDGWAFVAHISQAYKAEILPEGHYNTLYVKIKNNTKAEDVCDEIVDLLEDSRPASILLKDSFIRGVYDIVNAINGFLNSINATLLIVIVVGIGVSFALVITERRWEIVLLNTIGGTYLDVIKLFIYEGLIIATIAMLPGITLGVLLAQTFINQINQAQFPLVIFYYMHTSSLVTYGLLSYVIVLIAEIPVIISAIRVSPIKLLNEMK
ncbi:MAG: FtsX-like permease family protein [Candidatus Asgardarchaeia archaeon]